MVYPWLNKKYGIRTFESGHSMHLSATPRNIEARYGSKVDHPAPRRQGPTQTLILMVEISNAKQQPLQTPRALHTSTNTTWSPKDRLGAIGNLCDKNKTSG